MSRESPIDVFRRATEKFSRSDPSALDEFDPEAEIRDFPTLPDAQWHQGIDGVAAWAAKLWQVAGAFQIEVANPVEVGTLVVVDWRLYGSGKRGGVPVVQTGATIAQFRDGKIARVELFRTRKEALEAVGLRE
jgi:ketosteroid isomerase-like protein